MSEKEFQPFDILAEPSLPTAVVGIPGRSLDSRLIALIPFEYIFTRAAIRISFFFYITRLVASWG